MGVLIRVICVLAYFRVSSAENIFCVESGLHTLSGDPCSQPILHGPTRYAYNTDMRTCQSFTPGCATNGNNFETINDCQKSCGGSISGRQREAVSGPQREAVTDAVRPESGKSRFRSGPGGDKLTDSLQRCEQCVQPRFFRRKRGVKIHIAKTHRSADAASSLTYSNGRPKLGIINPAQSALYAAIYTGLPLWKKLGFSFTKWCGRGTSAVDFDDLGFSEEADKCCRGHDRCPDWILSGETMYNLTNDAFYTRLSCECDEEFRKCLHTANTLIANQIGNIYFDLLGTECYREDYPIKNCKQRGGLLYRKCLEYELDTNAPKVYQWFSVPPFYDDKEKNILEHPVSDGIDKLSGYSPTKWCGRGTEAVNYEDLGFSEEADMCCRAHDLCPDWILKGESMFNLTNEGNYTRLSCECEEEFRKCLHNANTQVANQVGNIYFNTLGAECYRMEHPIKNCKQRGGLHNQKCLEYELDKSGPKIYQWFSVPNYEYKAKKKLRKNAHSRQIKRG